jgi:hypothetical protein
MAKITYVPTRFKEQKIPPRHISMKRLGEIFDCSPQEIEDDLKRRLGETMWTYGIPFAEGIQCPFGERDLMDDTCYIGSDVHRCKYFRRYIHDGEHAGTIKCCCPKPRIIPEKGKPIQLSLFDF